MNLSFNRRKFITSRVKFLFQTMILLAVLVSSSSAAVHYLSSADLPVTLGYEYTNDTIRFNGTKIVSATSGIAVAASGVYIDLGGDTLMYGTGGGNSVYGVKIMSSVYSDITLHGGWIIHGGNDNSDNCRAIYVVGSDNLLIDSVGTISVGINSMNIFCSTEQSHRNVHIRGGRHLNHGYGYTSRDDFLSCTFFMQYPQTQLGQDDYNVLLEGCYMEANHVAVRLRGFLNLDMPILAHVAACSLIVDARNDLYTYPSPDHWMGSTNAGGISIEGLRHGSTIHDNVILADSNYAGFDVGIGFESLIGTPDDPILIYNNYIEGHRGLDAHYGELHCKGIKWRAYTWTNKYIHIFNNHFKVKADGDPSTEFRGPNAHAFNGQNWLHNGSIDSFIVIENNTFEAVDVDGNAQHVDAARLEIDGYAGYKWKDAGNSWRYNTLMSSNAIYSFGPSEFDNGCAGFKAVGDTIIKPAYTRDDWVVYYWGYSSYIPNLWNEFVDPTYLNGASEDDRVFVWGSNQAEFTIGRTLKLLVQGNNGLPIQGAQVWAVNNYGDTVLSGITDECGKVSNVVSYIYESQTQPDSLNFNTFVIGARFNGETDVNNVFNVNWTTAGGTHLFTMSNSSGSGTWDGCEDDITTGFDITPPGPVLDLGALPGTIDGQVTLSWTASGDDGSEGQADHYDIRYYTQALTLANWNQAEPVSGIPSPASTGTNQQFSIPSLEPGRTFYFGIIAYDEANNASSLATTSSFAAGIARPTTSPDQILTDAGAGTATLYCNPVETYHSSLYYQFEVADNNSFVGPWNAEGSFDGQYIAASFSGLPNVDTLYWHCRAISSDLSDSSVWSVTRPFSLSGGYINTIPETPVALSPAGAEEVTSVTPTFTAQNATDADGDILTYEFQVFSRDLSALIVTATGVAEGTNTTSWTAAPGYLLVDSLYSWRVRAYDGSDYSNWSEFADFAIVELGSGETSGGVDPYGYPNPVSFISGQTVKFVLPDDPSDLTILTVAGSSVFSIDNVSSEYEWDGRNNSGHQVAVGVYLWFLDHDKGRGKIVVVP